MAVQIPLRAKDGRIRAYAVIDEEDAAEISRHTWYLDNQGYARRGIKENGRRSAVLMHRQILNLTESQMQADHLDRDRLNNRRSNLRAVTHEQNRQNLGSYRRSTSQYRGVSWDRTHQKWHARVKENGKDRHLGYFDVERDAANTAALWRTKIMPYAVEAEAKRANEV